MSSHPNLNGEYLCTWQDGTQREVVVTEIEDGKASIIWNEQHAEIPGQGCVVGLDDVVPVEWLANLTASTL